MAKKIFDIGIVGGGIAGAAAALLLARAGHRVTLFDAAAESDVPDGGVLLQPSGLRVMHMLGLLRELLVHGARSSRLLATNARGHTVFDIRYSDWNAHTFGLGVHHSVLSAVLRNALQVAGVQLRNCVSVTRLVQQHYKAILSDDAETLGVFDCVVIADGAQSRLRHGLSIPHRVNAYDWGTLSAIVPDDGLTPGALRQWFHHARQMVGLMPVGCAYGHAGQPLVSLFWSLRANQLGAFHVDGLDAWKKAVLALAPVGPVLDRIQSTAQLHYHGYADVRMPYWHKERAVCIGDSGHATSPLLGQGINLALVDAMVLMQCFALGGRVVETLATYSYRRKATLRYYQSTSRWLTPFFQSDSRFVSMLRDCMFGPLCRMPVIKQHMAKTLSGNKTGWFFDPLSLSVG
jgi:2-polyprenyl-6-methoxyphenol hydroxylase-like FAD-dependent oxidoreductase